MAKNAKLRVGLALNRIALMTDQENFNKIKASLKEIEQIVDEELEEKEEEDE